MRPSSRGLSGLVGCALLLTGCSTGPERPGVPESWEAVFAGGNFSCGIARGGEAYCWGQNGRGTLGNGDTVSSVVPLPVAGRLRFRSVSASHRHACALAWDGAVYCWGRNDYGQFGDGTTASGTAPVRSAGSVVFQAVTAGDNHTCGLTWSGAAYCWGDNSYGQLGRGAANLSSSLVPVPIAGGLVFRSLSAGGFNTCGVTTAGTADCWGANEGGQLGNGGATGSGAPTLVAGGRVFESVGVGESFACGVTTGHAAYCWGVNLTGQLGLGTLATPASTVPVAVAGGLVVQSLSAVAGHVCALTVTGAAYCWGRNVTGELGDGSTVTRPAPVAVAGGLTFQSISSGHHHSCGLTAGGEAYCWGQNDVGQLGVATSPETCSSFVTPCSTQPVRVGGG